MKEQMAMNQNCSSFVFGLHIFVKVQGVAIIAVDVEYIGIMRSGHWLKD